jgi:hypothetical protein
MPISGACCSRKKRAKRKLSDPAGYAQPLKSKTTDMMKMNAGVWIGIIGGIVGILIAIGAVMATVGPEAPWIILGMLLLFGGSFFLIYKLVVGPALNARRLMKTGLPGRATIKEVRDTGVTINNSPQVKLILEVKNTLGQTYEVSIRTLVSRINPGLYRPGMQVPVKIDPVNEKNVVIDTSREFSPASSFSETPAVDEAALRAELEQLQQTNEIIALGGRPARAIVRKYHWLGSYVNGANPYVELELEVLPEHSSSFTASTKAVIHEAAVPKYQPGQEIFVKYDFYDNSKVVIDSAKQAEAGVN